MKFSACGGWFGKNNYETYAAAAEQGFEGVEQLQWMGLDFDKAKKAMEEVDIVSTAIVISSANKDYAEKIAWGHGMVWEDAQVPFVESFKESIVAAKALGVPNIIATTGNERSDVSRAVQHKNVVDTLKIMAKLAEAADIMIILEPLNILVDHKGYYLDTSKEAFEIIREVNSPNCKLLFDIYHQQITEGNLINNIVNNIDLIGHFHIADNPGRKEPGTGEINYYNVFEAISKTNFDGWLAFECGNSTGDIEQLCDEMWGLIADFSDNMEFLCDCGCEDCEEGCDCGCEDEDCDCHKHE